MEHLLASQKEKSRPDRYCRLRDRPPRASRPQCNAISWAARAWC